MTRRQPRTRDSSGGPADRHRFFIPEAPGHDQILRGETAHRISRVLRLPVGASVLLFDGSGRSWPATVAEVRSQSVRLVIGPPAEHPAPSQTVLLAGMIRPNRFEWLIEKATELGATAIVPVICARSAVRPEEVGASRLDRWRRIAIEAAEQCGRVTVPDLRPPAALTRSLAEVEGRFVFAAEPAHGIVPPLGSVLAGIGKQPLTVLIGPEGGLAPEEIRTADDSGGEPASLGPLILRAETAAIAALSILSDVRQRGSAHH